MKGTFMKRFLILSALVVAALAPQTAFAADSDTDLGAGPATHYDIVDSASGRIVGVLVPVAGAPGTLRVIKTVRAQAGNEFRATPESRAPLSAQQAIEQHQRDIEAQFHIDHSS
jgi:hypothetical protein